MRRHVTALVLAAGALAPALACAADDADAPDSSPPTTSEPISLEAQVASYDLAAGLPQRFIVGILDGTGGVVVGGSVDLDFTYLGDGSTPTSEATAEPTISGVPAAFLSLAGAPAIDATEPRRSATGEGGAYQALDVTFPEAGYWEVGISAQVEGSSESLTAAFEVLPTHGVPVAGDPAPRTVNLLPGDPNAPVKAIDSRAEPDGTVPDPELHAITVADAIATGRPTLIVVATPVYCVSRFCGPITDSVQAIAQRFGDTANFVHIEVWRDFEGRAVNRGAAEWIYRSEEVEPAEPWVFLVDGGGTIVRRWDNVANEDELEGELHELLG